MGAVEDYVAEVTAEDIRGTLFDFHHLRQEAIEYAPDEVELHERAIEDLLEFGKPEFYETVEIEDEPWVIVVIDGSAHLVRVRDDRCVEVRSVGPLDGGIYTEVTAADGTERLLEGTFTHPRLPGAIRIKAPRRRDRRFFEEIRVACRTWASRPARS